MHGTPTLPAARGRALCYSFREGRLRQGEAKERAKDHSGLQTPCCLQLRWRRGG